MLAVENWCIKVEDKVYGPYTTAQMQQFVQEGRLASWSTVSPAGSTAWRTAKEETTFAKFFAPKPTITHKVAPSKTPSTQPRTQNRSKPVARPQQRPTEGVSSASSLQTSEAPETASPNYILIFDIFSAASRVEKIVRSLGPAIRLAENVWSVSTIRSPTAIRNTVTPKLERSESLFVVEATAGTSSWHNYPPGLQAQIKKAFTPAD